MTILYIFLGIFAGAYATQTYYLAIMTLARARDEGLLTKRWQNFWFALWLVPGLFMDALLNLTVGTLLFLELPGGKKPWYLELVTDRLKRNVVNLGWRGKVARFICHHLLDKFDPRGRHC